MYEIEKLFKKCTSRRKVADGYMIRCRLDIELWRVYAPSLRIAKREAMRYFLQYYSDGEYTKYLNDLNASKRY